MNPTLRDWLSAFSMLEGEDRRAAIAWWRTSVVRIDRAIWEMVVSRTQGDRTLAADVPPKLRDALGCTAGCPIDDHVFQDVILGPLPGDELARLDVASGGYERLRRLRGGDVVADVGAHVGYFTEHAARAVGHKGMVVAFEPEGRNFACLGRRVHRLGNVVCHQAAVADARGEASLWLGDNTITHTLIRPEAVLPSSVYQPVAVMTLREALAGIPRLDMIKIDAEGAEERVLDGALPLLEKFQPHVVIDADLPPRAADRVCALLRGLDYVLFGADLMTEEPRENHLPIPGLWFAVAADAGPEAA